MRDLVDTVEMYLRTIFDLVEEGVEPRRARIAERLEQTQPTVSQTVARMQRDGLIELRPDRQLELTEEGFALAASVTRKHRLVERLLVDVIGLEWDLAHEEACRWEHVVSDRVERRLVEVLGSPTRSPYGNPIPGPAGAAARAPQDQTDGDRAPVRVADLPPGPAVPAVIATLSERLQSDPDDLTELRAAGIVTDARVTIEVGDDTVTVTGPDGTRCELPEETAHGVQVRLL